MASKTTQKAGDDAEMLKYLDLLLAYEEISESEIVDVVEDMDVLGSDESDAVEEEK